MEKEGTVKLGFHFCLLLLAGTVSAQVPIDSIRKNRPDGVPVDSGASVTFAGIVTATNQFGTGGPGYVQDRTGGVALYGSGVSSLAIGDSVSVTGTIDFYRGLTEIKNFTASVVSQLKHVDTLAITTPHLGDTANLREVNEGRLVVIRDAFFDTTPGLSFVGNASYPLRDNYGVVSVYIDAQTDIVGQAVPTGNLNVIGCAGQYANLGDYWSGYQLLPRSYADMGQTPTVNVMTIADAFIDANGDWSPDRLGQKVTVTGIVTVPCSTFSRTRTDIYIQDASGMGVDVFDTRFRPDLKLGDSLLVAGTCTLYSGKPELKVVRSPDTIARIEGGHTVPAPIPLSCRGITETRSFPGCLVQISGVTVNALVVPSGPGTVIDTSGASDMYVSYGTNIPGLFLVQDTFTLVGLKVQYYDGYEIAPRFRTDFSCWPYAETLSYHPIAEVQEPGADGHSSKYENQWVKVKGRVIGPNRVFTSGSSLGLYIQDSTNGINIYGATADSMATRLADVPGVELGCIGKVTEYSGLTELANGVLWVTDTNAVPVQPVELPFNAFLTEAMESKLVTVTGDVITPPAAAGGGQNFTIKNGTPGIAVRAVDNAGVQLSGVQIGKRYRCTGIVGQYASSYPFGTGYQLMLRFPSDLIDSSGTMDTSPKMRLDSVTPQVFNPSLGQVCEIRIASPGDRKLTLEVYDVKGRLVRELLINAPGHAYTVKWDGTDNNLRRLPIGNYILNLKGVLSSGRLESVRRLVVLGTKLN
jgi:DNA/RNA endonuclease YhcR with UshA esterase domain